jgi:hypothetical protein
MVIKDWLLRTMPFSEPNAGDLSTYLEVFCWDSLRTKLGDAADRYVNLSEVAPSVFSDRLAIVLNSWLRQSLTFTGSVFYGDNPTDLAYYGFDFGRLPANGSVPQSVVDESCKMMCTQSTEAILTHSVQVFSYSGPWLALLFASSAVLLATGLAGTALSWRTRVPDMLGYVTSMTYNNRYVALPERGGVLDASHRARLLRDLTVSISDVDGSSGIGRIAFTSETNARALEEGRKYV